jgi:hypothetical protein
VGAAQPAYVLNLKDHQFSTQPQTQLTQGAGIEIFALLIGSLTSLFKLSKEAFRQQMKRRHQANDERSDEHIHVCINLQGFCCTAAEELVHKERVFNSYSELVRAAITKYYQDFLERQSRLRNISQPADSDRGDA